PTSRGPDATLNRFTLEDRKVEKVVEHLARFDVSADGEKLLVAELKLPPPEPRYSVIPASTKAGGPPPKPEDNTQLSFDGLEVRTDPPAEWAQMYREVWRIERAYFY